MKSFWLREVRQILQSTEFSAWWKEIGDAFRQMEHLSQQLDELHTQASLMAFRAEFTQKKAIALLYRAGEHEDRAAQFLAEASEIENKSYEAVAAFESQRISVSDLYSRMGAMEHRLLSLQSEVGLLREATEMAGNKDQRREMEKQLKRKQSELGRMEKEHREAASLYARENARKMSLWDEVEHLWLRSLDINLGVSELKMEGSRSRRLSEKLFRLAEQHKKQAESLLVEVEQTEKRQGELEQAIRTHLAGSRRLFGCLAGENFVFWPSRESNGKVYAVPLKDLLDGYNIELKAGIIYLVDRKRGVEFLEPLPPGGAPEIRHDSRIDTFFVRSKE